MLGHVPSFGRHPRCSPDFLAYPDACSWYLGSEVVGCRTLLSESQSSPGLRTQPYPRALDLVRPGHLHGTGGLSAGLWTLGFLPLYGACVWV